MKSWLVGFSLRFQIDEVLKLWFTPPGLLFWGEEFAEVSSLCAKHANFLLQSHTFPCTPPWFRLIFLYFSKILHSFSMIFPLVVHLDFPKISPDIAGAEARGGARRQRDLRDAARLPERCGRVAWKKHNGSLRWSGSEDEKNCLIFGPHGPHGQPENDGELWTNNNGKLDL